MDPEIEDLYNKAKTVCDKGTKTLLCKYTADCVNKNTLYNTKRNIKLIDLSGDEKQVFKEKYPVIAPPDIVCQDCPTILSKANIDNSNINVNQKTECKITHDGKEFVIDKDKTIDEQNYISEPPSEITKTNNIYKIGGGIAIFSASSISSIGFCFLLLIVFFAIIESKKK